MCSRIQQASAYFLTRIIKFDYRREIRQHTDRLVNMAQTLLQHRTDTKAAIVSACLKLFAAKGFHNTSIDEIAKNAGITKGGIYWHFENKEKLFAAILDEIKHEWQQTVMRNVLETVDPLEQINRLFDNYILLFAENKDICLFLQRNLIEINDQFTPLVNKTFDQTAGFIAKIIERGIDKGLFKAEINSKNIAFAIIGSIAGVTAQCSANKKLRLPVLLNEIREQVLARLLN
jgi:AcrR family transcriptional regulator